MSEEVTPAPADPGQAAPAPVEWTSGFDDNLKGYVENKGFKDPAALATSYQNLEKLHGVGADQLLKLPTDISDREAMQPVYNRLGMPEQADGYTRAIPDTFSEDVYGALAGKAHELGLGNQQFQGLQEVFTEQANTIMEQQDAQSAEAFDAWQSSNQEGFQNAARVMAEVGMTEEAVESVLSGDKSALYDFLAKVGARTGESTVVNGDPPGQQFTMSAEGAKAKIGELMADETFYKQYNHPSKATREPAIKRMEELQKIAAGEG